VEWLSDTYSTQARMHDSPDAPLVELVWEWTDQDFEHHESVINSKHWATEGQRETLIGEQWVYPPRSVPRDVPIGLLSGHECGEVSDFTGGQPWPYTGPPIEYDEDDVPLCCPRYYGLTPGIHPESEVTTGEVDPVGTTCCNALAAHLNTDYVQPFRHFAGIPDWWRWELSPGNYEVTLAVSFGSLSNGGVATGTDCAHAAHFEGSVGPTHPVSFTLAVAATLCVDVFCLSGIDFFDTYTIRVDHLP